MSLIVTQVLHYSSFSVSLTDCPSNLKEAIDWILRVTGKDGQDSSGSGQRAITALTREIKKLLESVQGSGSGLGAEFESVMSALNTGSGNALIGKLAEGLQQFIGYNNGTIKYTTNGIGMSNDPLERIKDGILVFVYAMVQSLKTYVQNGEADTAMKTIRNGKANFKSAVGSELTLTANGNSNFQNVLDALKKVTDLKGDSLSTLAGAFKKYLGNVLKQVEEDSNVSSAKITTANDVKHLVTELKNNFAKVVEALKTQNPKQPIDFGQGDLKKHVDAIYDNNKGTFRKLYDAVNHKSPKIKQPKAKDLVYAVYISTSSSLSQLQKGYKSYYQGTTWPNDAPSHKKCAKIFLSCLPLIFSNLQHLYWKCKHDKAHGGWKAMLLNGKGQSDNEGAGLKQFMDLMSFSAHWLNGGKKGEDVESVMKTSFNEFSTAASGQSYAEFLNKFKNKGLTTWQGSSKPTDETFLSGLYLCSTSYFRHQRQKQAAQGRPPSSIREMLYWLMGLTATPQFGDLLGHIDNIVGSGLQVAVSGSTKQNETVSADKVTDDLITTCFSSPSVLNVIQGRVPPNASTKDPWLHDLYSNAAFPFKYPSSGAALFYALSEYTYALQFQLGFLYQQCSQLYVNTCGWFLCTYGQGVNANGSKGKVVSSHICSVGCTKREHNNSDKFSEHKSGDCEHSGCGESNGKASPLQAFLTDKLTGFSRGHPSGHSAHLATCSGSLCHVPMGFESHLRADYKYQGGHISPTLKGFCGSSNTPLCQLSETLTCLSKRTPRTLGDLFGFLWHLNGQLFNKANIIGAVRSAIQQNSKSFEDFIGKIKLALLSLPPAPPPQTSQSGLESALVSMASTIPFLYQFLTVNADVSLPVTLFNLKGISHQTKNEPNYQGKHDDLYSMYNQHCDTQKCGPYFCPLTHSDGATYAPKHASSYLSWVLYLSDDLQSWFQELLDEFKNIDCSTSGCVGESKCQVTHKSGTHGTDLAACSCYSVVHCAGVLPLLYRHGFRFNNALHLKNGNRGNSSNKRTCQHFTQQLQKVINGNPLSYLLTSIDDFLFLFRYYFLGNLSAFWTVYICLILYTFFFLLDTLHLRSHLKLTASHTLPPLVLLTSGKSLPITKLTYIGQ